MTARLLMGDCMRWMRETGPVDAIVTALPYCAAGCASLQAHEAWMRRWRRDVQAIYGDIPVVDYSGPSLAWAERRIAENPSWRVVLDPFMGTGSTGVLALQAGREFIGIEIEPSMYELAERHIAAMRLE